MRYNNFKQLNDYAKLINKRFMEGLITPDDAKILLDELYTSHNRIKNDHVEQMEINRLNEIMKKYL